MTMKTLCLCTSALLLTLSLGTARADDDSDGTGLALDRDPLPLKNAVFGFGWNSSLEDHRDYVEDYGIGTCVFCHDPELEGYVNGAPGCLTCHDRKWDGDADSDAPGELSAGNQLMNFVLNVNWASPLEDHRDYVEDFGIGTCGGGCHAFDMGGKPFASTFAGPGCLSCHDQKWDDDDGGGDDDSDSDSDSDSD